MKERVSARELLARLRRMLARLEEVAPGGRMEAAVELETVPSATDWEKEERRKRRGRGEQEVSTGSGMKKVKNVDEGG